MLEPSAGTDADKKDAATACGQGFVCKGSHHLDWRTMPPKKRTFGGLVQPSVNVSLQRSITIDLLTQQPTDYTSATRSDHTQKLDSAGGRQSPSMSFSNSIDTPLSAGQPNESLALQAAPANMLPGPQLPGIKTKVGKNGVAVINHRQKTGASSKFRGVTRHSTTGRFEAHLWDASSVRPKSVR